MKRFACFVIALFAVACSNPNAQLSMTPSARQNPVRTKSGPNPITHVIVIMQENRSFDNFFYDFPGANGATSGNGHDGTVYQLKPLHLKWTHDLNHYHRQFLEDYDSGLNDGWEDQIIGFKDGCKDPENHPKCWIFKTGKVYLQMPYSYVYQSEIQPYWDMATQYTLGDNTYSSNNGPTFASHQYMIAGQAMHASEVPSLMPWGCDQPSETLYYLHYGQAKPPVYPAPVGNGQIGPAPCFPLENSGPSSTYPTVADTLDNAGISWRYYVQAPKNNSYWLNAFEAVKAVRYGTDWNTDISSPDTNVLSDISSGNLQHVSWVMPHGGASDHAGSGSGNCGPDWVASIVNAIGTSKYWKSTAIIVMWDEWGGWYDHVLPPQYPDPVTGAYEGLGYRIPLLVVSPYAKTHYISHTQHEIASSLHYIEQTFGLPFLGQGSGQTYADQRADAFDDIFDYTQKPTKFKKIKLVKGLQCTALHDWPPEIDY